MFAKMKVSASLVKSRVSHVALSAESVYASVLRGVAGASGANVFREEFVRSARWIVRPVRSAVESERECAWVSVSGVTGKVVILKT